MSNTWVQNTIEGCPNCGGTGSDPDFGGGCHCEYWVRKLGTTSLRQQLAGNVATTYSVRSGSGQGTGNGTSSSNLATEKQIAFLRKLIAERTGSPVAERASVSVERGSLTKAAASELIDALLATSTPKVATTSAPSVRRNQHPAKCTSCGQQVAAGEGSLAKVDGRWVVAHLDACPERTVEVVEHEHKRGDVHVIDGSYYRVHIAQRSGNPYAAKAIIWGEALWGEDGSLVTAADIEWEYVPGAITKLDDSNRATAAEAHAFGHMVGRCCFCSHEIDTPESVEAGYGPVCAKKYGLPWG